jgi:hypothetical protein
MKPRLAQSNPNHLCCSVMTYLISATLVLLATAALIGSFALVERRLVSANRWGRILGAELVYKKACGVGLVG